MQCVGRSTGPSYKGRMAPAFSLQQILQFGSLTEVCLIFYNVSTMHSTAEMDKEVYI